MATQAMEFDNVPARELASSTEAALRSLINAVDVSTDVSQAPFGKEEQVLLDFDLDGARYLLLRMPIPVKTSVLLTPREKEIVRLVALGHSNKIIADVLGISSFTVCTHVKRIFLKLGVSSRAAMVAQISGHRAGF